MVEIDQNTLQHILNFLDALLNPSSPLYSPAVEAFKNFENEPQQFVIYLAFIFSNVPNLSIPDPVRQLAGIILKNMMKNHFVNFLKDTKNYIKGEVFKCLYDHEKVIRDVAANTISKIISVASLQEWPDLIPQLVALLSSNEEADILGSFTALKDICEDVPDKLDTEEFGRPLNSLIPKFISFFGHPNPQLRKIALQCINSSILKMPAALIVHMDSFLQGLSLLASDPSSEIRSQVCHAIVLLVDAKIDALFPQITNIFDFMTTAVQDQDICVSTEACDFFAAYCYSDQSVHEVLVPYVPRLVPLFAERLVYSEEKIFEFESQDPNDADKPDRPEDIRPYISKTPAIGGSEDYDGNEVEDWNLRSSAASALDAMSNTYGDSVVLAPLFSVLQFRLEQENPWIRESGILALGIIADGCFDGITDHLPILFPYLFTQLQSPIPQVRYTTCWTIGRYSKWIMNAELSRNYDRFFEDSLQKLLECVLDPNKKVQESACSALSIFEEEAGQSLLPYLEPIVQTLTQALARYQAKNVISLYDTIGTLADSLGETLNQPSIVAVLIQPLLVRWESHGDNDTGLFPLLECLTSIAQALQLGFQEFALPLYTRSERIIQHTLFLIATSVANNTGLYDTEHEDFLICSLDLLSGMAEGLGMSFGTLMQNSNILNLVLNCLSIESLGVKQSSLALIGDIARSCISHLLPILDQVLTVLIQHLEPDYPSICNNASWAIGEIAMRIQPEQMHQFITPIINKIGIVVENTDNYHKNLVENVTITIGRLGIVCPNQIGPFFQDFGDNWLLHLKILRDQHEKESAYRGLCMILQAQPNLLKDKLSHYLFALCGWSFPGSVLSQDIKLMLSQILLYYQSHFYNEFSSAFSLLPIQNQKYLKEEFYVL